MKIRPLQDRIIVKRVEEKVLEGGLVVPDTAKEKPQRGIVTAVGAGRVLEDGKQTRMNVSKGDHVLFAKYSGTEIKVGGEELLILRPDEVLAVLDETSLPGTPPGSDYPKPKTRVKK